MQFVFEHDGGQSELHLRIRRPAATVGDLAVALGLPPGPGLVIGRRVAAPDLTLDSAGARQAVCVRAPADGDVGPAPTVPPSLTLVLLGGLVAGPSWPLAVGETSIGRDPGNDVVIRHATVSSRHCTLTVEASGQVTVTDLGSRNGTWSQGAPVSGRRQLGPGAVLRLGGVLVSVVAADGEPSVDIDPSRTKVRSSGTVAFNRPPRPASPPSPPPLRPPSAPASPTPAPLSLVALVAPLGFAAVMVAVLGRLVYALFALLGPVMALGTWLEARRRNHRTSKRQSRRLAVEIDELRAGAEGALRAELSRLHADRPHPGLLLRRAAAPSVRLWERRAHHPDFLHLHAGTGDLTWKPPLAEGGRSHPASVDEALAGVSTLGDAPWPVDLSDGGVVGIVGDRAAVLAVARSLVCQAATQSGPADLAVAILTDPERGPDWDWAKWLPHTLGAAAGDRLLASDAEASDCLVRSLLAAVNDPAPVTMVVIDADGLVEGRGSPARSLLRGDAGPVAGMVLAPSAHRLPAVCSTVVELRGPDGECALLRPQRGEAMGPFLAAGVEEPVARSWARQLARFDDPEAAVGGHGPPRSVALSSLLGFDAFDPLAVAKAWREGVGERRAVATPIGVSAHAIVTLDLDASRHVRVVGASGSGRTELLLAVVAGLAIREAPDGLNLVLLDAAGRGSFSECARLPHVVGVAGDAAASAALPLVQEELARREEQRLEGGSAAAPARLVVVVNDLPALARLSPDAADILDNVAARGPSVGVHMAVTEDETDASSPVSAGATIYLERDGRGTVAVGGPATAFQAAGVTGRATDECNGVDLAPFVFAASADFPPAAQAGEVADTELAHLVAGARAAFAAEDLPSPRQLWSGPPATTGGGRVVALTDLLGIDDVEAIDPGRTWRRAATEAERLRVPMGTTPDGKPLLLDLKESALGGMGPHGLVVGATGSGKSELLRSLVIALAVTHHPDQLNFVLVDFKGGATFAAMAELPHVAGMITNLEDDVALVDRMHDALFGEQRRRQERLRQAGNLASVRDHEQLRSAGADLEPLPSLLVIVDEFAELLAARPDFIDLFVAVGRVGRSLGMHLLLASQRVDEGRLRGLESHLSYRIGLRTFSAVESRAVIGATDAYQLPSAPGGGYLKVADTAPQRFHAAFTSSPCRRPGRGTASVPRRQDTVADAAVSRLRPGAERAHQVWLPPLEPTIALDRVLPPLADDPERGLVARGWPGVGRLAVPVGLVDKPRDQAQHLLVVDLAGAEGNLAVVGAPQSGKSTLLRTLLTALFVTHAPSEAQAYCLDFGGGGLLALAQAPHVGAVAGRLEREWSRRVVSEVEAVLARRERLFQERGIDSVATFRALRAAGRLHEEEHGDVFLVIDNWPAVRQEWETLEATVADIAARGLGFGVHVVVTANHWMELRHLKDSLGGRLELRLNQPVDSAVDRRKAANVPSGAPGRGLTSDGLHFQACLPRLDGRQSADGLPATSADLVARLRASWSGPEAPPVRLLPAVVPFTDLPGPSSGGERGVPVGIAERDLAPVYVDLAGADPHFLVFGDGGSGKTGFLKTFLTGLIGQSPPEQASVLVVDYRRGLLDAVHPGHLFGYAGAAPAAAAEVARLREVLVGRLPGPEVPAHQLRARSWWRGPEMYVVVDDYDLVVTPGSNPLSPLLDLLAHGRDLGLHVVLARRVAGASRAMFEPVLQRLKELASPGLILSGDGQEGPLLGPHRSSEQVPGRGLLVRRKHPPVLVQAAWAPV